MNTFLLDNLLGYLFSGFNSIWVLLILILDIMALYSIWNDKSLSGTSKVLWSALIFFLPVLGLILWFLFGKEGK
jgi:hypothetical protein